MSAHKAVDMAVEDEVLEEIVPHLNWFPTRLDVWGQVRHPVEDMVCRQPREAIFDALRDE